MQLPQDFTRQMLDLLGEAEWIELRAALEQKPVVSVRVKNMPFVPEQWDGQPVPWCNSGRYLNHRPNFTLDPLFHAGAYYVQEASSMFVEQALKVCGTPKAVLDLCAAPGGKSTLLRSLLPHEALLVSNDPVRARANVLAENIIKWGHEGCFVSCNYPKDFQRLGALFDLVLVDAPCSGEGMFRRDNPAIEMWSLNNTEECAQRQRDIVESIWPIIKQGGHLIYSTCTYNTLENEQNILHFCDTLGAELVEVPIAPQWGIKGSLLKETHIPVYRFMPHRTKGEGLFLAVLRKKGGSSPASIARSKKMRPLPKDYAPCLQQTDMLALELGDATHAVRAEHADLITRLQEVLYPLHFGVGLCYAKGRKQIPHHSLAMSRLLSPNAYPIADLTLAESIAYLRHEAIKIDAPRGYALASFQGQPLGFVNNLGSRANNLYPAEWRIRH